MTEDPFYLTEPHVITKSFQLTAAPISPTGPPCVSTFEGRQPGDSTPHYLPEKNPFVDEMTRRFGVPREAALGYTETLYPEYRKKIRSGFVQPPSTGCDARGEDALCSRCREHATHQRR